MKQHELIAIEGDVRKNVKRQQTDLYHLLQKKHDTFFGLEKTYRPLDEDGELLPSESKIVQQDVGTILGELATVTIKGMDTIASKDEGNRGACADIMIGDEILVKDVPVLTLLSLETELNHLKAVFESIPTLPLDAEWKKNEATGQYFTEPTETIRKKKVPRVLVHFEPTKEHPGKSDTYMEDIPAGMWTTKRISTAMPGPAKKELLERLSTLTLAVKRARERANNADAKKFSLGQKLMGFLIR